MAISKTNQPALHCKTDSIFRIAALVSMARKLDYCARPHANAGDGGRFCPDIVRSTSRHQNRIRSKNYQMVSIRLSLINHARQMWETAVEILNPLHIAIFVALSAIVIPSQAAAIADQSIEQRVKAAFLYKFGGYVEWPPTAFATPDTPFTLCVLKSDPEFNATLEKMVQKENVQGRSIAVQELQTPEDEAGCHILYIGVADPQYSSEVIEAVRGRSVLTVSESASQGIIGFLVADNRVRFNINEKEAAENGLVISSKLLDLAVNVTRREPMGEP